MSEATKDSGPDNLEAQQDNQPSGDEAHEALDLSAEEAERVASQFTPAWEVASEEPSSPATDDVKDTNGCTDPTDETQPPHTTLAANETQPDAEQAAPPEEPQGPVDIIADIPKRTDIQIKDEPSIVVPVEEPTEDAPQSAQSSDAPSTGSSAAPAAAPAVEQRDPFPEPTPNQRGRNIKIVVAVVGVAALLFTVGGVRALLSAMDDAPKPIATTPSEPPTTSVEAFPPAPPEPAPAVEATAEATAEAATTPTPALTADPVETAKVPPKTTAETKVEAPVKTSTPPKPTTTATTKPEPTAPTPTKTAEPKPPKTATPPATDKPPSGGIVRETPF